MACNTIEQLMVPTKHERSRSFKISRPTSSRICTEYVYTCNSCKFSVPRPRSQCANWGAAHLMVLSGRKKTYWQCRILINTIHELPESHQMFVQVFFKTKNVWEQYDDQTGEVAATNVVRVFVLPGLIHHLVLQVAWRGMSLDMQRRWQWFCARTKMVHMLIIYISLFSTNRVVGISRSRGGLH